MCSRVNSQRMTEAVLRGVEYFWLGRTVHYNCTAETGWGAVYKCTGGTLIQLLHRKLVLAPYGEISLYKVEFFDTPTP